MCQSLTSDLCRQTNLTLSEPRPFSSSTPPSSPLPPVLVLFISTERNKTYCKTFLSLFFNWFCKLLSCHIVIGINLCASVFCFFTFMFLLNSFFSVCTYLYKVYMKLLDRLKGLMTSLSLTLKTKKSHLVLFVPPTRFLFTVGMWIQAWCVVGVLVRWLLFLFSSTV